MRDGATLLQEIAVADLDVFDRVAGNAADDGGHVVERRIAGDVADEDPLQPADWDLLGAAHARAETEEHRRVADVAHAEAGDGDVLEDTAIHRLQREAAAPLENAI